jgi:hypothetical protein
MMGAEKYNSHQGTKQHLEHLNTVAKQLCDRFGIEPDHFAASPYLLGRNGPDNSSAIYLWLNSRYGSESNWESSIDFEACAKLFRDELLQHISDQDLGYILM